MEADISVEEGTDGHAKCLDDGVRVGYYYMWVQFNVSERFVVEI